MSRMECVPDSCTRSSTHSSSSLRGRSGKSAADEPNSPGTAHQ
ncbi:hypothetical protein ACFYPF_20160 [Micromonospora sp. NPDC005223]